MKMKPLYLTFCLAGMAAPALAAPVALNPLTAAATFSQANFAFAEAVDGDLGGSLVSNGWALSPQIIDQTGVVETVADVVGPLGTTFTFTLTQNFTNFHTLGRFRLSVTTDNRADFADGLQTGGDVTANWTQLTPTSAVATNGASLTIQGDNSILASGTNPDTSVYTVTASTTLNNITGFRIEALEDPSLPANGPGRQPGNGNFVLQELQVDAVQIIPEPASAALVTAAGFFLLPRRRR
jgi:hypothetical protein